MKKLFLLLPFLILQNCTPNTSAKSRAVKDTTSVKPIEKPLDLKEEESKLVQSYQETWDSVKLTKDGIFPQYETYYDTLSAILADIAAMTDLYAEKLPKLEKLRLKLIDSKKRTEASKNWLIYGQPMTENDLHYPCENYLRANANDPDKLDIVDYAVKGQTKKGWKVLVKYRAVNLFGALIMKVSTFEVQYNPTEKVYQVVTFKP